jgi:hypothetical protein
MMDAYASRQKIDVRAIKCDPVNVSALATIAESHARNIVVQPTPHFRFSFDGQIMHGTQTPAELGLEDDDLIDTFLQQIGGFRT